MAKVLVCWIGHADLKAAQENGQSGLGPIGQALRWQGFDEAALLSDHAREATASYCDWLRTITPAALKVYYEQLSRPTHFGEIYQAAVGAILDIRKRHGEDVNLCYHLSPGTPAMAAVWMLLGKKPLSCRAD